MESYIVISGKLGCDSFSIEWDSKKPFIDLKKRIQKKQGIPIQNQKLFLNDTEVSEYKKLSDYKVDFPNLSLINLNHLKVTIYVKNIILKFFLKASDSIFDLKKIIYKKENIPMENMQLIKSENLIDENKLIEEFIPDLNFKLKLLETEKIKINLIENQNKETIYVDPFSNLTEIEEQIKKDFDYRLKYKDKFINDWNLLIQYNIKNNDNIELIKSRGKIKIFICDSRNKSFEVNVYLEQKVSELKEYFSNIYGENGNFIFNGCLLDDDETFSDLDLYNGCRICYLGSYLAGSPKLNLL